MSDVGTPPPTARVTAPSATVAPSASETWKDELKLALRDELSAEEGSLEDLSRSPARDAEFRVALTSPRSVISCLLAGVDPNTLVPREIPPSAKPFPEGDAENRANARSESRRRQLNRLHLRRLLDARSALTNEQVARFRRELQAAAEADRIARRAAARDATDAETKRATELVEREANRVVEELRDITESAGVSAPPGDSRDSRDSPRDEVRLVDVPRDVPTEPLEAAVPSGSRDRGIVTATENLPAATEDSAFKQPFKQRSSGESSGATASSSAAASLAARLLASEARPERSHPITARGGGHVIGHATNPSRATRRRETPGDASPHASPAKAKAPKRAAATRARSGRPLERFPALSPAAAREASADEETRMRVAEKISSAREAKAALDDAARSAKISVNARREAEAARRRAETSALEEAASAEAAEAARRRLESNRRRRDAIDAEYELVLRRRAAEEAEACARAASVRAARAAEEAERRARDAGCRAERSAAAAAEAAARIERRCEDGARVARGVAARVAARAQAEEAREAERRGTVRERLRRVEEAAAKAAARKEVLASRLVFEGEGGRARVVSPRGY